MYIFNSFYLLHSYNPSFLICLSFNMVFFRSSPPPGHYSPFTPQPLQDELSLLVPVYKEVGDPR